MGTDEGWVFFFSKLPYFKRFLIFEMNLKYSFTGRVASHEHPNWNSNHDIFINRGKACYLDIIANFH